MLPLIWSFLGTQHRSDRDSTCALRAGGKLESLGDVGAGKGGGEGGEEAKQMKGSAEKLVYVNDERQRRFKSGAISQSQDAKDGGHGTGPTSEVRQHLLHSIEVEQDKKLRAPHEVPGTPRGLRAGRASGQETKCNIDSPGGSSSRSTRCFINMGPKDPTGINLSRFQIVTCGKITSHWKPKVLTRENFQRMHSKETSKYHTDKTFGFKQHF